jgi:hypothetical protein
MQRDPFIPATDQRDPLLTGNDGLRSDPEWGWSVNYGHYGSREHGVPVVNGKPAGHTGTFSVEMIGVDSEGERFARAIWGRRHELSALVAAHPIPNVSGVPTARLRIGENRDGSWTVREYDFNRWSEVLPPR